MNEKLLEIARKAQELEKLIESTPECYSVRVSTDVYPEIKTRSLVHIKDPGQHVTPHKTFVQDGKEFCYLSFAEVEFLWLR